jgi:hypothetical protein
MKFPANLSEQEVKIKIETELIRVNCVLLISRFLVK